jgi:hypothetical protein
MQVKDKSTFERLEFIDKVLDEILSQEGLLLPGTIEKIRKANAIIEFMKRDAKNA